MASKKIPVYIPNISTQKLADLLTDSVDPEADPVEFEVLEKGAGFRAPELAVVVHTSDEAFLIKVVKLVLEGAQLLGATQFSIEHEGFDMRLRPINISAQQVAHLMIASGPFKIDQINIF
ncbi:MAG: hypothetical protein AAF564_01225 [Bacteroidota bacterium]